MFTALVYMYSQEAYTHVLRCNYNARPNRSFVQQLSRFESEVVFDEQKTDISDPNF